MMAVMAVAAMTADAQIWLGGQVGFQAGEVNDLNVTQYQLLPEIGYKLTDRWDMACRIGIDYSKVEHSESASAFVFNPYARYTFYQTGKVGFVLDMGFTIKTGDFYDSAIGKTYGDETAWGFGIAPGVKYAASDKVTFVATVGGLGYHAAGDDHAFGLTANGNALQFGCYYNF